MSELSVENISHAGGVEELSPHKIFVKHRERWKEKLELYLQM